MAKRAVNSVGFNNYNNIAFESRRHKKHSDNSSYSTSPLKVVSLAVLIAMSPMADVGDVFAVEPNKPKVETVNGVNTTKQNEFVPLPANCKVLKDVHIEHSSGGYMGFKLINTDGDTSNYEIVEFTNVGATGRVLDRGILKAVSIASARDGSKNVGLYGIQLSKSNLDNYAPQEGIFNYYYPRVNKIVDIFYGLINHPDNHGAVNEISIKSSYIESYRYPTDLKIYKRILGIN